MCEHCGSMRPTYFGVGTDGSAAAVMKTEELPRAEEVCACGECARPLMETPGGGRYCATCDRSSSPRDRLVLFCCPKCRIELKRDGPDLRCPYCGSAYRRP